jgi:Na+-driven multidrug efflux pump
VEDTALNPSIFLGSAGASPDILQAFNGAGDTLTPTIVNFFGFWILEIPLAYFLAITAGMHSNGVYVSIVVAQAAIAGVSIFLFKRGRWKRQQI